MKSLFEFDKRQQRGIFVLLFLIAAMQTAIWLWPDRTTMPVSDYEINQFKAEVDSLKAIQAEKQRPTIYPFNPNYIDNFKAYRLGLSVEEHDRLLRFRESGKFINSPADFQKITKVSDAWLDSISPYFKFPEWTQKSRTQRKTVNTYAKKQIIPTDLNTASQHQLIAVYGIGAVMSQRILEKREELGKIRGFIQLESIYGMTPERIVELKKHFFIQDSFTKLHINDATLEELRSLPYIDYNVADRLINERTLRDGFKKWDEVVAVRGFPASKIAEIQLYLTLD